MFIPSTPQQSNRLLCRCMHFKWAASAEMQQTICQKENLGGEQQKASKLVRGVGALLVRWSSELWQTADATVALAKGGKEATEG